MTSMIPYDRYQRALAHPWLLDGLDTLFGAPFQTLSTAAAGFKMDVEDTGDGYVVSAELPGVTKDQIDVELNEGHLSISVNKTESEEISGKNYLHKETSEWSATRGVYLKDAATEGLSAKLDGGVLTISVPKQVEKPNVTKVAID